MPEKKVEHWPLNAPCNQRIKTGAKAAHPTPLTVFPLLRPWRQAWPGYANARAIIPKVPDNDS